MIRAGVINYGWRYELAIQIGRWHWRLGFGLIQHRSLLARLMPWSGFARERRDNHVASRLAYGALFANDGDGR
jgi:hypothetical protein